MASIPAEAAFATFFDLLVQGHVSLYSNDIGTYSGTPGSETGDVPVDPLFVDVVQGNYHLRATSPLIDQGVAAPDGNAGDYDAAGDPRVVGAVDIGAYELQDLIFVDGFD
jgi:hypothetical protein